MSHRDGASADARVDQQQRYGLTRFEPAGTPSLSFEVLLTTGKDAVELRASQARAIKELLTWLHTERPRQAQPR